jgi:hypothetical protein
MVFFAGSRTEGDIEIQKADKCKLKNVKCNYLVKEPKERISILHLFSAVLTERGSPFYILYCLSGASAFRARLSCRPLSIG